MIKYYAFIPFINVLGNSTNINNVVKNIKDGIKRIIIQQKHFECVFNYAKFFIYHIIFVIGINSHRQMILVSLNLLLAKKVELRTRQAIC